MASFACEQTPVLLSIQNSIAWVTLNRADEGNRLDATLATLLTDIFKKLNEEDSVRVIVLQAQGKHFCLGADMNHMRAQKSATEKDNLDDALLLARLFETIAHVNKPVIAVVHGKAYGGGVGLVACADIVLCEDTAEFCLSELKLGLIPAVISPYVVNAVGVRQAKRWMMTALPFSAEMAEEAGLVHALFNVKTHQSLVDETIHTLLQSAPQAMSRLKTLMARFESSVPVDERARMLANLRTQPEAQEGLSAFLEKRKPYWSEDK